MLKIHRHRIRTTHESMRDKRAWRGSGRATIDPNHSPQVGRRPLPDRHHPGAAATPVDAIIEDAQHDLVRRAQPAGRDHRGERRRAGRATTRSWSPRSSSSGSVLAELVGGQRDVFTAACADQLSGLHGPKGKPCPARPWVCLLCPLAVFAPTACPEPAAAEGRFSPASGRQMPTGPVHGRLRPVLPSGSTRSWTATTPRCWPPQPARSADRDDELPLRPEERHRMSTLASAAARPGHRGVAVRRRRRLRARPASRCPPGPRRPVFDDDEWDFTDVIGPARPDAPAQQAIRLHRDQRPAGGGWSPRS